MESVQMGVVPIAFNSFYSLTDIITDKVNGVIVQNNNMQAFVHDLTNLMLNSEQRILMAEKAVESSYQFTQESIAKQWVNLYNS
jgi:glycosyltransferase involved in cell wall biosynthesis